MHGSGPPRMRVWMEKVIVGKARPVKVRGVLS
jgi:hypothetical protein